MAAITAVHSPDLSFLWTLSPKVDRVKIKHEASASTNGDGKRYQSKGFIPSLDKIEYL